MCTPTPGLRLGFDPALLGGGLPDWAIVNGLVRAIDLSNYQPQAQTSGGLSALIQAVDPLAWYILIRLSHEGPVLRQIAANQIEAVQGLEDRGLGGYGWAYGPINANDSVGQQDDPRDAVRAYLDVLARAGESRVPILWIDAEGTTNLPTVGWMDTAFDEAVRQGQRPGIYSNPSWLSQHFGNTQAFAGQPLWTANYNGHMDVDDPSYQWGGMQVVGHQFTSTPIDRSVFLPEAVV